MVEYMTLKNLVRTDRWGAVKERIKTRDRNTKISLRMYGFLKEITKLFLTYKTYFNENMKADNAGYNCPTCKNTI